MLKKMKKEDREKIVRNIQGYFLDERDEEIGNLAAEDILQFVINEVGPYIYNNALNEARKVVGERMLSIEDELYALEKPQEITKRG